MKLLFDIGATNTRIGVSRNGKIIAEKVTFPTPKDFKEGMREITEKAKALTKGKPLSAAVGGIAGPLDKNKKELVRASNLPDWNNKPLKSVLEASLHTKVYLENDTVLAGIGEALEGAGRGYSIVVYMTFSSGVGGARIVNGRIDANVFGFEPGFQIVGYQEDDGFKRQHYLQYNAGGIDLKQKYGQEPADITDPKIWDQIARWITAGVYNAIVFWSPECVVLGGPVLKRAGFEKVVRYAKEALFIFPEPPIFKEAELGDYGGLHGALHLPR